MARYSENQFVGATGTFYVMSRLSYENLHASCTFGNAPNIDILVSSLDGSKTISIQVKTSKYARRSKGRGKNKLDTHLDYPISYKTVMNSNQNLFFAFVDLWGEHCKETDEEKIIFWQPTVYIIPSIELKKKCIEMGWTEDWWRLYIELDFMDQYKENWDIIKTVLNDTL